MNKYIDLLVKMIQCNTVSTKEDKAEKFLPIHKILAEGLPNLHVTLEKNNIYGNLIFKWKGTNDKLKPILLMNHMDTAEVKDQWKYEGFSGAIKEGYIWGRGTIDTKGPLCAMLCSCEELIINGFLPKRDIYFVSTRNEEIAGDGAIKIVHFLKNKGIKIETLLDEGGAILDKPMSMINKNYAMIGVAEKGHIILSLSGDKNNLKKVRDILENKSPFKGEITEEISSMLKILSKDATFPVKLILKYNNSIKGILEKILPKISKEAGDMIRTSCICEDINNTNNLKLTIKVARTDGIENTLKIIDRLLNDYNIKYEIKYKYPPSKISSWENKSFKTIELCIKSTFGDVGVSPYLMLAGTDSRYFDDISENCYRFAPLDLKIKDMKRVHNVNERISVDNFLKAIEFYKSFILDYNK